MNENTYRVRAEHLDTEVIERILNHLSPQEADVDRKLYPLGGLVHVSGVGQISVTALQAELEGR